MRETLVGKVKFNGNTHQYVAYPGPCGRSYFSGGTFAYNLCGTNGRPATPTGEANATGVFSFRSDSSEVQIIATSGMNPVKVAFSPERELFAICHILDNINERHDRLIQGGRGCASGPVN